MGCLTPQTMCDGHGDCKANPFVFIITIAALAHILHAECLLYIYYSNQHTPDGSSRRAILSSNILVTRKGKKHGVTFKVIWPVPF